MSEPALEVGGVDRRKEQRLFRELLIHEKKDRLLVERKEKVMAEKDWLKKQLNEKKREDAGLGEAMKHSRTNRHYFKDALSQHHQNMGSPHIHYSVDGKYINKDDSALERFGYLLPLDLLEEIDAARAPQQKPDSVQQAWLVQNGRTQNVSVYVVYARSEGKTKKFNIHTSLWEANMAVLGYLTAEHPEFLLEPDDIVDEIPYNLDDVCKKWHRATNVPDLAELRSSRLRDFVPAAVWHTSQSGCLFLIGDNDDGSFEIWVHPRDIDIGG